VSAEKLRYSSRTERVLSHGGDTKLFFPDRKGSFPQRRNYVILSGQKGFFPTAEKLSYFSRTERVLFLSGKNNLVSPLWERTLSVREE
jgi:hypothetical protein